jgi:hypothetical protein
MRQRLLHAGRGAVRRLCKADLAGNLLETPTILGGINGIG